VVVDLVDVLVQVVLRLGLLAALELDPRQLGHALDEPRDLITELGAQLVALARGVLDDVVQQRGGDRLVVELELGADLGGAPGVQDELLPGPPLLPFVGVRGEAEGPRDQVAVNVRVVGRDGRNQLVYELLMLFVSLKDGHISSVLRPFLGPSPVLATRNSRAGKPVPMLKGTRPWPGTDVDRNGKQQSAQPASCWR
jgi:hypothetical protein